MKCFNTQIPFSSKLGKVTDVFFRKMLLSEIVEWIVDVVVWGNIEVAKSFSIFPHYLFLRDFSSQQVCSVATKNDGNFSADGNDSSMPVKYIAEYYLRSAGHSRNLGLERDRTRKHIDQRI